MSGADGPIEAMIARRLRAGAAPAAVVREGFARSTVYKVARLHARPWSKSAAWRLRKLEVAEDALSTALAAVRAARVALAEEEPYEDAAAPRVALLADHHRGGV